MYSYRFAVEHSNKLFEVPSACLDAFSDLCDQRTCNLTKHCSVYDVFDSESALELNPEVVTLTPGTFCIFITTQLKMEPFGDFFLFSGNISV
jgi:hypothetical protein